jgi:hypothetical protein
MSQRASVVLKCLKYVVIGALTGGVLGIATFLPGEMMVGGTTGQPHVASPWLLTLGVASATARIGALVGFLFFLIRRVLMGEVADPLEGMR